MGGYANCHFIDARKKFLCSKCCFVLRKPFQDIESDDGALYCKSCCIENEESQVPDKYRLDINVQKEMRDHRIHCELCTKTFDFCIFETHHCSNMKQVAKENDTLRHKQAEAEKNIYQLRTNVKLLEKLNKDLKCYNEEILSELPTATLLSHRRLEDRANEFEFDDLLSEAHGLIADISQQEEHTARTLRENHLEIICSYRRLEAYTRLIALDMSIQSSHTHHHFKSTHCWEISDITPLLEKSKSHPELYIESDILHTPQGYSAKVIMFFNGTGEGPETHASIYLQIMVWPDNDSLDITKDSTFRVSIIPPEDSTQGSWVRICHPNLQTFKRPPAPHRSDMNNASGFPSFIPFSDIQNYINKHGSITLHVGLFL